MLGNEVIGTLSKNRNTKTQTWFPPPNRWLETTRVRGRGGEKNPDLVLVCSHSLQTPPGLNPAKHTPFSLCHALLYN